MARATLQNKWTVRSIAAGFVGVPVVLLRNYSKLKPALTDFEFIFVINLVDYFRDGKPAYPSWETLASDLEVEADIVGNTIDSLIAKGYVDRVQYRGDRGEITGYDIKGLRNAIDALLPKRQLTSDRHEDVRNRDGD
jgi:hypothetical protein